MLKNSGFASKASSFTLLETVTLKGSVMNGTYLSVIVPETLAFPNWPIDRARSLRIVIPSPGKVSVRARVNY